MLSNFILSYLRVWATDVPKKGLFEEGRRFKLRNLDEYQEHYNIAWAMHANRAGDGPENLDNMSGGS